MTYTTDQLITLLQNLKKNAIENGKTAKRKAIKDFYFGKTLAYDELIKLIEGDPNFVYKD